MDRRVSGLGVGMLRDAARRAMRAAVAAVDPRGPFAKLVVTPPYMIVHMLALLQVQVVAALLVSPPVYFVAAAILGCVPRHAAARAAAFATRRVEHAVESLKQASSAPVR